MIHPNNAQYKVPDYKISPLMISHGDSNVPDTPLFAGSNPTDALLFHLGHEHLKPQVTSVSESAWAVSSV